MLKDNWVIGELAMYVASDMNTSCKNWDKWVYQFLKIANEVLCQNGYCTIQKESKSGIYELKLWSYETSFQMDGFFFILKCVLKFYV